MKIWPRILSLVLRIAVAGWFSLLAARAADLWVVDPTGLSPAEQALLASLQGRLNQTEARLWVRGRSAYARVLEELRNEGWNLKTPTSLWDVVASTQQSGSRFLTCDVKTESLNVATSLAGPRRALIADVSLRDRLTALGMVEHLDVRSLTEAEAWKEFQSEFRREFVVHQPVAKTLHLRDFAVARSAYTFFEGSSAAQTQRFQDSGPAARVFGWGRDEHEFVQDVSRGSGFVIPSDWALNLSALPHLTVPIPTRPVRPKPEPLQPGERVVTFVVTDGDNVQWLLNGFTDSPGFWGSPLRGSFAVTWELAPTLAELAPRVLAYLYRSATPQDDFVAGPSGVGYYFPSQSPIRTELAVKTARSLVPAQLQAVSLLNSGGGLEAADDVVRQSQVTGVFFKDYAPYHRYAGSVRWHAGKPIISYRFLLWEQKRSDGSLRPDWLPEGVAQAIAKLPAESIDRFSLVNVHAWSFRDSGGPMGAIRRTIDQLPPHTRVVTATEFLQLLPRPPAP